MAVDSSMSPTTIDTAALILHLHLLNTSVRRLTTARTRQTSTLPTLDNFQSGDELLVQLPLLSNALSNAIEAVVDTEESGIDIDKRNY